MKKTLNAEQGDVRQAAIVRVVLDKYLGSLEFNGLSIDQLRKSPTLESGIKALIAARALDLVRGDRHPNPHIKAMGADSAEDQLRKIDSEGLGHGCLYPTPELLSETVDPAQYAGRPFSLELARGAHALDFRPFEMVSLEYYRNDPRFKYDVNDIHGSIIYDDRHFDDQAACHNRIVMDRFGFCHSQPDLQRAVAVLLRDLNKLEPEQQQHWSRHQLTGEYRLHPGFEQQVHGSWNLGVSVFDAFLEEKNQINIMCGLMGLSPLFRTEKPAKRPRGFGFLIRPTQKELRDFELLLDKHLSDDLNTDFFDKEDRVIQGTSTDGKPMTTTKGTIQLLQEWLEKSVELPGPTLRDAMIKTFKKVRNLRQKPAHKVEDDTFDPKYLDDQRGLIVEAYEASRTLRQIFQLHPATKAHKPPSWLVDGPIWTR